MLRRLCYLLPLPLTEIESSDNMVSSVEENPNEFSTRGFPCIPIATERLKLWNLLSNIADGPCVTGSDFKTIPGWHTRS